ncbi:MAG TPA: choice-of-anchor D domain-containing protein, partial [Myxococcaceae bacterium]|nr:choice-of-anchor D domain-containing protein [Myxococcaceae bacterium]
MRWTRSGAVAVVALAALACGDGILSSRSASFSASPSELAFGPVALGRDRVLEVTLTNTGRVSYELRAITPSVPNVAVEGFAAGPLTAGESRTFRVRFTPAIEGAVTGALTVATDDAAGLSLPLAGLGVRALAEVKTAAIDFGQVDIGTARVESVRIVNPTLVETAVHFSIEGEDAAQFSSSESGAELILLPGQERQLPVAFRPAWMGLADGRMAISRCTGCEPYVVSLSGEGVLGDLDVFPARIQFGRVELGAVASQRVTLTNDGNKRVDVQAIALRDDAAGSFALAGLPPLPLEAPSFVPISFDVMFEPTVLGEARAVLEVAVVTDGAQRTLKLPVIGEGGASCVRILPSEIDFLMVPQGMSATRTAEVLNLCGHEVSVLDAIPASTVNGYFSLRNPPQTLVVAAGQRAPIDVLYTPKPGTTTAEGRLSVRVVERTAVSTLEVKLKGASKTFAPCVWEMHPAALDYGAVPVGAETMLGVALKNAGTDQCFVGAMQLAAGTDPEFTAAPTRSALLDPGDQVVLKVGFRPASAGSFAGLVEAWVNHPTDNHPTASLLGTGVESCFALQPTLVDFGLTKLGCGPRTRQVAGFNTCSAPVTLADAFIDSPLSTEMTL